MFEIAGTERKLRRGQAGHARCRLVSRIDVKNQDLDFKRDNGRLIVRVGIGFSWAQIYHTEAHNILRWKRMCQRKDALLVV